MNPTNTATVLEFLTLEKYSQIKVTIQKLYCLCSVLFVIRKVIGVGRTEVSSYFSSLILLDWWLFNSASDCTVLFAFLDSIPVYINKSPKLGNLRQPMLLAVWQTRGTVLCRLLATPNRIFFSLLRYVSITPYMLVFAFIFLNLHSFLPFTHRFPLIFLRLSYSFNFLTPLFQSFPQNDITLYITPSLNNCVFISLLLEAHSGGGQSEISKANIW